VDNKREKLFVIKQSKGCKFMRKMHQNTFGGRAPHRPAGAYILCFMNVIPYSADLAYFYLVVAKLSKPRVGNKVSKRSALIFGEIPKFPYRPNTV